jgi:hypothetical protein
VFGYIRDLESAAQHLSREELPEVYDLRVDLNNFVNVHGLGSWS